MVVTCNSQLTTYYILSTTDTKASSIKVVLIPSLHLSGRYEHRECRPHYDPPPVPAAFYSGSVPLVWQQLQD